jgi:hypothetical protein
MKRASRAGSSPLEVSDGRAVSSLLWPRRAQKNCDRLLSSQYRGAEARERDPDLSDDDHRPVSLGRLAPGERVHPCGHGIDGCVLAPGLQSPGRSVRIPRGEGAAHPGQSHLNHKVKLISRLEKRSGIDQVRQSIDFIPLVKLDAITLAFLSSDLTCDGRLAAHGIHGHNTPFDGEQL